MVLNYRQWGLAAVLLLPLGLAACGGGGRDFSGPIKIFSAATDKTAEAFDRGSEKYDALETRRRLDAALAKPSNVRIDVGDCDTVGATRCRVGLRSADGKSTIPLIANDMLKGAATTLQALASYAEALARVAAVDSKEFDEATGSLETAILKLAGEADKLSTKAGKTGAAFENVAKAYGTPTRSAINLLFDWYLDSMKLREIRASTARVQGVMPDLTLILAEIAGDLDVVSRQELLRSFRAANNNFDANLRAGKVSEEGLLKLQKAADALDGSLANTTKKAVIALGDAHGKLAKAASDDLSPAELWKALQYFGEQAAAAYKIAQDFQAAGQAPADGK